MENVTETIETPEQVLAEEGVDVLLEGREPNYHTILEVWEKVLSPAESEIEAKITPQWAVRITGTYPGIRFADMGEFQKLYFGGILDLLAILREEIATDREALSYDTPEDDKRENRQHYINVLTAWQVYILRREVSWDWGSPTAEIELAALSELHKMFFAEGVGVTDMLGSVGFEFDESDQETLAAVLQEVREEGNE